MARVSRVALNGYNRIMIASDIHGNGHLLWRLLERMQFCSNDALILLGDYIEKGVDSLETIRQIIRLSEAGNVFALQGNCDTLWEDLENKLYRATIVQYMLWRKNSILCDMCKELNIPISADLEPKKVTETLWKNYREYFEWLSLLPHIIESEDYVFVHAGVDRTTNLEALSAERCLVRHAFYEENLSFDKFVVVGHMVLNNYCAHTGNICSYMPIIDNERRIIMVDGGNGVKNSGQQNLLIIQNNTFHCEYEDDLPKLKAIGNQKASDDPISIIWNHNQLQILECGEKESRCRHLSSGREVTIPNSIIFEREGINIRCYDYTDYHLAINIGDTVSFVQAEEEMYLVKNKGVLGWASKELFTSR